MDDKFIIKNIKRKKECGLEMLVNVYGGFIATIIRQNLNNLDRYEDECIDDVLLSIWNNINRFDESKNTFKNWIASITRYRIIDYKRKYIKTLNLEEVDINKLKDNSTIEDGLLKKELRDEIENLLSNLNPRDKDIFIKHYLEDKDIKILAKEMGVKTDNIYNRLSRGRKKLRVLIAEYKF